MAAITPEIVPSNIKLNVTNVKSIFNGGGKGGAITRRGSGSIVPKGGAIVPKGRSLDTEKLFELNDYDPLEKRVAANEKKITILKRIIKTQQNPFGGGPLEEINSILQDIGNALSLDFGNRITQKKNEIDALREGAETKKRGGIEAGLESVNKITNKVGTAFSSVTAPARSILDKVIGFFGTLATGFLADKALTWLSENKDKVTGFFEFLQDHGKKILIGLGAVSYTHLRAHET